MKKKIVKNLFVLLVFSTFSFIQLKAQNACETTTITPYTTSIGITNIPQGNSNTKIEYQGPSTGWSVMVHCDGDCDPTEEITGINTEGDYTIKVHTNNPYCYYQETVDVNSNNASGPGGGGSCEIITLNAVVTCDNKGTSAISDDELIVSINPSGNNLSSVYHVKQGQTLLADNVPYGTPFQKINTVSEGLILLEVYNGSSSESFTCAEIFNTPEPYQNFSNFGCECVIDIDEDGICADDDCDDQNPNVPAVPGTTCDDGDSNTNGDVIQSDGCTCEGVSGGDCELTSLNIVKTCDTKGTTDISDDTWTMQIDPQGVNLSSVYHIKGIQEILVADNIPYGTPYTIDSLLETTVWFYIYDGDADSYVQGSCIRSIPGQHLNESCSSDCSIDNDNDGYCEGFDCDDDDPSIGLECPPTVESDLWTERTTAPFGIFTTERTMIEDTLTAEKIIVQTDVYADYVFEKDYPLLPLPQLEQYIQQNHHLPNVPPANEIVAKGIDVSEMSVKHMEKIEELTLYLLQMNKRLEQLEKENERLREIIKSGDK